MREMQDGAALAIVVLAGLVVAWWLAVEAGLL